MASRKLQFLLLTLALSLAVATVMVAAAGGSASKEPGRTATRETPVWSELRPAAGGGQSTDSAGAPVEVVVPSFADIAERANPAVVNITATEIIRQGDRRRFEGQGPFEFFFPNPRGRPDGREDDPERQDHGGSGFLISEDGYLLTNYHVIEGADRISVRLLGDSRDYLAQMIGADPDTDLALLKIEADRPLPVIPLGDSERLRVGDWVLAIGNPLAYEHTVTVGVVSAKGRKLWAMNRDSSLDNFIQTDAAINRGNSGGPLLNARGEAIGINAAISVAGQGISFAIPVNMAKDVMAQLLSKGRVERGYLGVEIRDVQRDLDPEKREYFGIEGRRGAFVEKVTPGLPAASAGLRRGDAIVSVDGSPLASSDDLIRVISSKPPGQKVALGIVRDGREQTLTAELADRTGQARDGRGRTAPSESQETPVEEKFNRSLGIVVHEISPEIRRGYGLDEGAQGVILVSVDPTSQAWEKGLREGDVIVEVNRKAVGDMASFQDAMKAVEPGDLVNFYVVKRNTSRFVTLRLERE